MSTNIVEAGRNAWQLARPGRSGLLIDAADYYRAFYDAALRARRHIFMSGWQFDSGVPLLRGTDAVGRNGVRLLRFLNGLCDRNPALRICILAWDFHLVFAPEREWLQGLIFHFRTNPRLVFRFVESTVEEGAHHQKYVTIDGRVAFLGGIDLCESRFDDRRHLTENELRRSRGRSSKPYHDVQAYFLGGDVPCALAKLFAQQWARSETREDAPPCDPTPDGPPPLPGCEPRGGLPLGGGSVALSRTDPCGPDHTVREVEHLFEDALLAAERLVYIETQYFSSRSVCDALARRMEDEQRPRLQIVLIVNPRAEALKEEIAVGLRQAKNLERLRQVAPVTGHALGIYHSLSAGEGEGQRATYIHSKLMIVDDRFITVGSANLTNRSMGTDTELHASWEAPATASGAQDRRLARTIRRARVSLLAEHGGLTRLSELRGLFPTDALVERLDGLACAGRSRLRPQAPTTGAQKAALAAVDPDTLPFDPVQPEYPVEVRGPNPETSKPARGPRVLRVLRALFALLRPSRV